jgi:hypothetical protein
MGKPQDKKPRRSDPAPQGEGDVFSSLLDSVSSGLADAAGDPEAMDEVVRNAVRSSVEREGALVLGAKAIVVASLRSAGAKDDAALLMLTRLSKSVLAQASSLDADLETCTKGLILGAIASAKDHGVDRGKAATAVAAGALEAAREVGETVGDRLRTALKEPMGGVTIVLPEPTPR